jgi:hypothetical protein
MSEGVPVIVGDAVPAFTVTLKVVDAEWPYASAAVQVTIVFPIGNVDPDAGEQDTATAAPYWSVAVGVAYVSVEPAWVAAAAGST